MHLDRTEDTRRALIDIITGVHNYYADVWDIYGPDNVELKVNTILSVLRAAADNMEIDDLKEN